MPDPEDIARDRIWDRWNEIQSELSLIGVSIKAADVFEPPEPQDQTIRVATQRGGRVRISIAQDMPDLIDGNVTLEIRERYSFAPLTADPAAPLKLLDYRYQISFMPELLIKSERLIGDAHEHWGDLLLTQRKFFRFDGEDQADWQSKSLKYRNQHPIHHLHSNTEALKLPLADKPGVLAVACYALISFEYERWLGFAQQHPEVLAATRQLLPDVAI